MLISITKKCKHLIDTSYISCSQPNHTDNIKPESHMETNFAYAGDLYSILLPHTTTKNNQEKNTNKNTLIPKIQIEKY